MEGTPKPGSTLSQISHMTRGNIIQLNVLCASKLHTSNSKEDFTRGPIERGRFTFFRWDKTFVNRDEIKQE